MMRVLATIFMVQLSLISVCLGEHKKWSEDENWKYTKEKLYTDMDDKYSNLFTDEDDDDDDDYDFHEYEAVWQAHQDHIRTLEDPYKYSKDKQENGDTDEDSDERTNCGIGLICDRCDHFKHILAIGENFEKVCCKSCSEHFEVGYKNGDQTQPFCTCNYDKITGDCWKGLACSSCDDDVVGKINGVPVCCENCVNSGHEYGIGGEYITCDCLHNGKK